MIESSREWTIGLAPWIVQDGNYGDFAVGETHEFALEFEPMGEILVVEPREHAAVHLGGTRYRVDAPVVFTDGKLWMIDPGVPAYRDGGAPQGIAPGTWLSGEVSLGIDPFSYYERHAADPRVPAAIHTWRITRIRELTAPAAPPGVFLSFEEMDWVAREVRETDAWTDPAAGLVRTYELVCELVDVAPRRRFSGHGG